MEMRYPVDQTAVKTMSADELYNHFQVRNLFQDGQLTLVYSHIDRVIIGGAVPIDTPIELQVDEKEIGASFFLERREVGIINVGGTGAVKVDSKEFELDKQDGLYLGKGTTPVTLHSSDGSNPARFYLISTPAHADYPAEHIKLSDAEPLHLGDLANSNERTIYKYIHPDGVQSCQLVMGMTLLQPNNMWNTMPAHLHARRMEVYLYFDIEAPNVVFHLMGEPNETRHLIMRDGEAVISPSWSIHSGMGTNSYSFIWAMAGENQSFADMDAVSMDELR